MIEMKVASGGSDPAMWPRGEDCLPLDGDDRSEERVGQALLELAATLRRLGFFTRDDYAHALIAACAEAAEGFAAAWCDLDGSRDERPAAQFPAPESRMGLMARAKALGERALAAYDDALERAPACASVLEEQRAELGEVVALLEPLSHMLQREASLVDARLEAALAAVLGRSVEC